MIAHTNELHVASRLDDLASNLVPEREPRRAVVRPRSMCWSLPQMFVLTAFRITPCSHRLPRGSTRKPLLVSNSAMLRGRRYPLAGRGSAPKNRMCAELPGSRRLSIGWAHSRGAKRGSVVAHPHSRLSVKSELASAIRYAPGRWKALTRLATKASDATSPHSGWGEGSDRQRSLAAGFNQHLASCPSIMTLYRRGSCRPERRVDAIRGRSAALQVARV
jgi:hypothetical protein